MKPVQTSLKLFFGKLIILFIYSSFGLFLFSLFRVFISNSYSHLYLNWNLFLAFLPLVFLYISFYYSKNKSTQYFFLFLTFLFLPNAPYLITDSFHIAGYNQLVWFDTLMFYAFAFFGLILYLSTIFIFLERYKEKITFKLEVFFVLTISFTTSFGIFLGRTLRFNSWDIITNPFGLLNSIINIMFYPLHYKHLIIIVFFWTIFLFFVFYVIKFFGIYLKKYFESNLLK